MRPTLPVLIVFGLLCLADPLWSAGPPEWWQATQDLLHELKKPETELFPLVQQAAARTPQTAQEAMVNLCLLMRAGMTAEAASGLEELKRLAPDLHHAQINHIYYETCDRLENWELAQKLLETFAENVTEITLGNRLFKALLSSGWTVDKIDRWLTARPPGLDGFWIKERLRFGVAHGRGRPLIEEMTEQLKQDPSDIQAALVFLDALLHAQLQEKPTLTWMAAAYRPRLLTEAADLASRLQRLKQWEAAIVLFRESLPKDTRQLSEEELERLGRSSQLAVGPETLRVRFEIQQREEMATCLLELGRHEEAQAVMVEAADLRRAFSLGSNPLLAGRVQGVTGARTIENRIQEGEATSMEDPRYWLDRADYYHGRELAAEEETALQRGLELALPKPESARPAKRAEDLRSQLVSRYARFLATQQREEEAVALLRRELGESGSASSARAAHLLAFDFAERLRPEDEVVWTWLARQSVWEHSEERLLWRMLQKAKEALFSRAEELADGQHPSRAYTLGWIMNRMGFPERSLPLLRSAYQRATEPQERGRAAYALFESYRDTGDWSEAEQSFVRANQGDWGECFSDLALRAAQAGAKTDAMRLWQTVVKVNPSELRLLRPLAQAGLANELNAFYDEFERALPSSDIPRRARGELFADSP